MGTAGLWWGALIGAQVSDHVFLLMSAAAVALLFSNTASMQLGADVGVAVGPVGRALEGDSPLHVQPVQGLVRGHFSRWQGDCHNV